MIQSVRHYFDFLVLPGYVNSSFTWRGCSQDTRDVGITEILSDADAFAKELARARVIWSPVPLSRNEAVFKPGTYRMFIQISNTHVKLLPPFSSSVDRPVLSPSPFSRSSPANISWCAPRCAPVSGWVGGCSTPGIARRLPAMSRQVDVTARVRGVNVLFKIRMLQHITSTSWPPYSAFVFAGRL